MKKIKEYWSEWKKPLLFSVVGSTITVVLYLLFIFTHGNTPEEGAQIFAGKASAFNDGFAHVLAILWLLPIALCMIAAVGFLFLGPYADCVRYSRDQSFKNGTLRGILYSIKFVIYGVVFVWIGSWALPPEALRYGYLLSFDRFWMPYLSAYVLSAIICGSLYLQYRFRRN